MQRAVTQAKGLPANWGTEPFPESMGGGPALSQGLVAKATGSRDALK